MNTPIDINSFDDKFKWVVSICNIDEKYIKLGTDLWDNYFDELNKNIENNKLLNNLESCNQELLICASY